MADMEDSLNISESLSAKSGQLNDIMNSLPEENSVKNEGGSEDENKSLIEDDTKEQKQAQSESLPVENAMDMSAPNVSEEKSEIPKTSSNELDENATDEPTTTETNSIGSEEHENLLSGINLKEEVVTDPNTSAKHDQLGSQESNSELPNAQSESNVNSKNSPESSAVEGGSHRCPDRKSKVEYRKIKSEVTGEAETSESEGEDTKENDTKTTDQLPPLPDAWMDILGNGLLKKRVLQEGKGQDTRPDRGQLVNLQVAGHMEDGKGVDWNRNLEFILGEGEVIQALDLAVALMELEEVCELVTDPKYAYGKAGKPEGNQPIPPDAKLTYELQLLAVRDGPNITNMTDEERVTMGEKKREIGNNLYTEGDYAGAINSYQRAIKYLSSSTSEQVQSLRVKCWNNMAAAQLKIKAYSAAEKSCSQVLQVDPDNIKALFRKGKVLAGNGDTDQALVYIKKADQLDPSNKTIRGELNRLKQLLASEKQNERSMYQRMLADVTGAQGNKKNNRMYFGWPLVFGATVVAFGGILVAVYLSRH